ncbi:MAG: YezD family protein [Methylotenera sp.]|nr:YezD family protein [Methylotenera sp.]
MTLSSKTHIADTSEKVTQEILRAVETVRQGTGYGSIEITLHEGRVTQIEKREKFRVALDSKT